MSPVALPAAKSAPGLLTFLQHPLFLLVAGAALTSYFLPRLMQRSQNRQKETELKVAFVAEISDVVLDMITMVQFFEQRVPSFSQAAYDEAYRKWETARVRITVRMRGYFGHPSPHERWERLGELITSLYALSGTSDPTFRRWRIEILQRILKGRDLPWDVIDRMHGPTAHAAGSGQWRVYQRAWFQLRDAILDEFHQLADTVLQTPMTGFEERRLRDRFLAGWRQRKPPPVPPLVLPEPPEPDPNVREDIFGRIEPPDSSELDEQDPKSLRKLAIQWFNSGHPDQALPLMDRAVALAPDTAGLHKMRAFIRRELGQWDEAIADGRIACELEPEHAHHWYSLGETYVAAKRHEEALSALEQALRYNSTYQPTWLVKGHALDGLGRHEEADDAYRKAGMEPDDARRGDDAT